MLEGAEHVRAGTEQEEQTVPCLCFRIYFMRTFAVAKVSTGGHSTAHYALVFSTGAQAVILKPTTGIHGVYTLEKMPPCTVGEWH